MACRGVSPNGLGPSSPYHSRSEGSCRCVPSAAGLLKVPAREANRQLCDNKIKTANIAEGSHLAGHADDLGAGKQPSKCAHLGQLILAGDDPCRQRC
jgi:hypothetical protein